MTRLIQFYIALVSKLSFLPPLFFRLILAYGFYEPAMKKWSNIQAIVDWFTQMGIPAPALNAYMAASTEAAGCVLLLFGLGTRFISIPLTVVMIVAIKTVHYKNGFPCGENGYEIPFYFIFMLFSLIVTGAGALSFDALIAYLFNRKRA